VGLVGKYVQLSDAYLSVIEAVKHAGMYHRVHTEIIPIDAESEADLQQVKRVDALIVPGGFGVRGVEGKIAAIRMVREKKMPFLGICLGLQMAVVEYARNMTGLVGAHSVEFDTGTPHQVVGYIPGQEKIRQKGGTMRLGTYPTALTVGSLAEKVYKTYRPEELQKGLIKERHRHRYEVNPQYIPQLEQAGLTISGRLPEVGLVEFIELPQSIHPYFIATQAHPEFRSRPERPHPLFAGLIEAALKQPLPSRAKR
jgi:CTP synthase